MHPNETLVGSKPLRLNPKPQIADYSKPLSPK